MIEIKTSSNKSLLTGLKVKALISLSLAAPFTFGSSLNGDLSTLKESLSGDQVAPISEVISHDKPLTNHELKSVVTIPIKSLKAVQNEKGEITFFSEDGRFAFVGDVFDAWTGTYLSTFEEIKKAASKSIDLKQLGVSSENVGIITKGSGEKVVTMLVDPQCVVCHELIEQAQELYSDYTFEFIITPILGEKSVVQAMALFCADDRDIAWKLFLNNSLDQLGRPISDSPDCDPRKISNAIKMHQLTGMKGVPVTIAPNKIFKEGYIDNLAEWLEGNIQDPKDELKAKVL